MTHEPNTTAGEVGGKAQAERTVRELAAALEPFARIANSYGSHPAANPTSSDTARVSPTVTLGDLRRARDALARARSGGVEAEPSAAHEAVRLSHVIEAGRTTAADALLRIEAALASRSWLAEAGRGSYAYDDDRYQREFGGALEEIRAALEPLRRLARDWTDCPTNPAEIVAARTKHAAPAAPPVVDEAMVERGEAEVSDMALLYIRDAFTDEDTRRLKRELVKLVLTAALQPAGERSTPERVRHVKRGTEYEVLGEAEGQVSTGAIYLPDEGVYGREVCDGTKLVVYQDPTTGKLWWRFPDEFSDGRFAPATPPTAEGEG